MRDKDIKNRHSAELKKSLTDVSTPSELEFKLSHDRGNKSEGELLRTYTDALNSGLESIAIAKTPNEAKKINEKMKIIYAAALNIAREMDTREDNKFGRERGLDMEIELHINMEVGNLSERKVKNKVPITTSLNIWGPKSEQLKDLKAGVTEAAAAKLTVVAPASPVVRPPQQLQQQPNATPVSPAPAANIAPITPQPAQQQAAANIPAPSVQPPVAVTPGATPAATPGATPVQAQLDVPPVAPRQSIVINPAAPASQISNVDANRVVAAKISEVKEPEAASLQAGEYKSTISSFLQSDEYTKAPDKDKESQCTAALRKGLRAIAMADNEARAIEINNDLKVVFKELDSVAQKQNGKTEQEIDSDVDMYQRIARRGSKIGDAGLREGVSKAESNKIVAIMDGWQPNGLSNLRKDFKNEEMKAAAEAAVARHDEALNALGGIIEGRPQKPDNRTNEQWDSVKTRIHQDDFQIQFAKLSEETKGELKAYVTEDINGINRIDINKVSNKLSEYAKEDKLDQFKQLYKICPPEMQDQLLKNTELQNVLGKGVTEGNKEVYDYLKTKGADLSGADKVVLDKAAADKALAEKNAAVKAAAEKATADKAAEAKALVEKPIAVKAEVPAKPPPVPIKEKAEEKSTPVKPNPEVEKPLEKPVLEAKSDVKKSEEPPPAKRGTAVDDMGKAGAGFLGVGLACGTAMLLCAIIPGAQVAVPFLAVAFAASTAVGVTGATLWGLTKLIDALIVEPIKWVADKIRTPAQEKEVEIEKDRLQKAEQDAKKEKEKPAAKDFKNIEGVAEVGKALKEKGAKEVNKGDKTIQKPATPVPTKDPTVSKDTTVKNNPVPQR